MAHVPDVQELCQRLRHFFSTAESSEEERAGSQEDFAITFKVKFLLSQHSIAKPGQPRLTMPSRHVHNCTKVIQFTAVYAHMGAFAFDLCGLANSRSKISRCKIVMLQEAVPLEELWASIEKHWQARQAVAASQAALSDRAQQQRAVQKRLLMRFKDRQPGALAHLELLLAETFDQLIDLGELLSFALTCLQCCMAS